MMYQVALDARDAGEALAYAGELANTFVGVRDERFLQQAAVLSHELPRSLRTAMHDLRLNETHGAILVSGYPVDDARIGPTPDGWGAQDDPSATCREEIFFFLCGTLLGDAIAWQTQQSAGVMHDVLPIRGDENVQLNSASDMRIYLHVEDAFHPFRADYVGLMCLRNDDDVATTFATVDVRMLPEKAVRTLFEPRFLIQPDNSHTADDAGAAPRIPVMFGDPATPYLRLDPYFMDADGHDPDAWQALQLLSQALEENIREVVLRPGDVLFVDNYRAVHGRTSFRARYDGRDPWLKRLNVTRDLRKSRAVRSSPASRVIGTFAAGAR